MTGVLESHDMRLSPKGLINSGRSAFDSGDKPCPSLDLPFCSSLGGDHGVQEFRNERQNHLSLSCSVTCEIINWKKDECGFASKQSFATSNPSVNFGQREGSFSLNSSKGLDLGYFQHRAMECLDLPKPVHSTILVYLPARKGIHQLRPGDFFSWRDWVLGGCPGERPARTRFAHFYIAVDFADCLRYFRNMFSKFNIPL